jgi:hypothetical protein
VAHAESVPVALRKRAVRAYKDSADTYHVVPQGFTIRVTTWLQWVQRSRAGPPADAASAGGPQARPDDRRVDACLEPCGDARAAGASLQCPAGPAAHRQRV